MRPVNINWMENYIRWEGPKARWAILTLVYTHRQFYLALPSLAVLLSPTTHAILDDAEDPGHPDNNKYLMWLLSTHRLSYLSLTDFLVLLFIISPSSTLTSSFSSLAGSSPLADSVSLLTKFYLRFHCHEKKLLDCFGGNKVKIAETRVSCGCQCEKMY